MNFFEALSIARKIGVVAITGIIIAVMAGIIIWASHTRYETLYNDLNKEDVKKITILLEENKVPYQTSKDGKSIQVPKEMKEIWRVKIATLGVQLSGTVGYEVFDKQTFGTTSFVQRVNKQRALEGELIKTISYIRGIKRARVHLSIPESSPFIAEKKPPGASVVLELERGVSLTSTEIKGIGSLVSAAVEGMRNEYVVILDDRGKKLSENVGDPMTVYTANRIALESKMNRSFEKQVEEILARVVGEGKVIAKVSVALNYTESVSTETSYDGENAAVLSEVKNSQKLVGSRPSPQGIPGARSNLPGEKPQPGIPETKNNVDKALTTTNYNVPKIVTKSRQPSAGIKRVNVAVMIDGRHVPMIGENGKAVIGEDGKPKMQYEKWSDADVANFKAIVMSSLGINEKRGDTIVIKNMEFAQEDMATIEAIMRERENRELIKNIVKYLAIGFVIALFFFMVARPFIQWVTDNTVESVEDFLPKTLEELEKVQTNQKLPGLEEALPQIEEKLNPEKIEGNMLKEKIISIVENNPSKAAQIISEMIHAGESDKQIA
ncbi:MAG: flagellar M-ring protein FliF [Bacteriovoracaceae bacterium]|nr:flagellar M-ring protein FliF [Bacteriovoracaceae bacterium]